MNNIKYAFALLSLGALGAWYFFFRKDKNTIYCHVPQKPVASGLTLERAKALSDVMFFAMETPGTDEDAIEAVYDEISKYPNGFDMLMYAFGLRKYVIAGSSGGNFILDMMADDLNLIGWLEKELTYSELKKWRDLY